MIYNLFKITIVFFISFFVISSSSSGELDCNKFKKMSAKYLECNAKKLKDKTIEKVEIGKDKMEKSGIKDKLKKFKGSKTLSDLIKNQICLTKKK